MQAKTLIQDFIRNHNELIKEYNRIMDPEQKSDIAYYIILEQTEDNIIKTMEETYDR